MTEFPTKIPRWEFEFSRTALMRNIDNTIPDDLLPNALYTAWWLQTLRDRLCSHFEKNMPVIITSGYRSKALNSVMPGASKTSMHMQALAADIRVPGLTTRELTLFILEHMDDCEYDQIIDEYGRWVHIGLRPEGVFNRMEVLIAERVKGKTQYRRIV